MAGSDGIAPTGKVLAGGLALVIPVRDDAEGLALLLGDAQALDIFDQIVVVDDGSRHAPPRDPHIETLHHRIPRGPGQARLTGLAAVRMEHMLFADADDRLLPGLSDLVGDLARERGFDFCLFRHADSYRSSAAGWAQALPDARLWHRAGHESAFPHPARNLPLLAQTGNYPWNKLYRTGYLRRFTTLPMTELHEDIPLHWFSFLAAQRVLVSSRFCLWHHLGQGPPQQSHRGDAARLQMFEALGTVAVHIDGVTDREAWTEALVRFALGLAEWAGHRTAPATMPAMKRAERHWLEGRLRQWGALIAGQDEALAGQMRQRIAELRDASPVATRPAPQFPAPPLIGKACLRVACEGAHKACSPLAYPALAPLWSDKIALTDDPARADLILFAHPQDPATARPEVLLALTAKRKPVLALLSEEPFWDTLFSPEPLARRIQLPLGPDGHAGFHQRNHHHGRIFDFARLPYFLLTDHRFANAYAARFARNARRGVEDWQTAFAARRFDACFLAERRPEPFHDAAWPEAQLVGLSRWRTLVAESCEGRVWRGGRGWPHYSCAPRTADPDWHLDKLVRLDEQARMISAIENTHQPLYLSEKLFDAYVCGAMPLICAGPEHSLHRLGLPVESRLDLWGATGPLPPHDAARLMREVRFDRAFFRAYAAAQQHLAAMFCTLDLWQAERARLALALMHEMQALVEAGPA